MLLQNLQECLITAAVSNRGKVEQMPIFASSEIRLALLFSGKEGGDEAEEGEPHFNEWKEHGLLLGGEPEDAIVGLDDPQHVAEGLRGVEVHAGTEDHELEYLMRVDQGAEVDDAAHVQLATPPLVHQKIGLAEVVMQDLLGSRFQ